MDPIKIIQENIERYDELSKDPRLSPQVIDVYTLVSTVLKCIIMEMQATELRETNEMLKRTLDS